MEQAAGRSSSGLSCSKASVSGNPKKCGNGKRTAWPSFGFPSSQPSGECSSEREHIAHQAAESARSTPEKSSPLSLGIYRAAPAAKADRRGSVRGHARAVSQRGPPALRAVLRKLGFSESQLARGGILAEA